MDIIYEGFLKSGIIEDKVLERDWTLNDVLDMDETVDDIVQELINEMDFETKYLIVKDQTFNSEGSHSVGEIITIKLRQELSNMVSFVVSQYLKTAKVEFNDNNNTDRMDKDSMVEDERLVAGTEEELLPSVESDSEDKITTLKERIRKDTKLMSHAEKEKAGLV